MKRKASTRSHETAKARDDCNTERDGVGMMRLMLGIFLLLLVLLGVGMAVVGAFPPGPHTEQVEHVIPNDKFGPH